MNSVNVSEKLMIKLTQWRHLRRIFSKTFEALVRSSFVRRQMLALDSLRILSTKQPNKIPTSWQKLHDRVEQPQETIMLLLSLVSITLSETQQQVRTRLCSSDSSTRSSPSLLSSPWAWTIRDLIAFPMSQKEGRASAEIIFTTLPCISDHSLFHCSSSSLSCACLWATEAWGPKPE